MRTTSVARFVAGVLSLLCWMLTSSAFGQTEYTINFDDVRENYRFGPSVQAYQNLDPVKGHGVTVQGPGTLRVVVPDVDAFSDPHALRNEPGSEFGSENEDVEILLNGFEAQSVRVVVGLERDSPLPVTAWLEAWRGGTLLGDDHVDLGATHTSVSHILEVEAPDGMAINRVVISYGFTSTSSRRDAGASELLDSLLLRLPETVVPPPVDTTPPVVHILQPADGDTISNRTVIGYVVEDIGPLQVTVSTPARDDVRAHVESPRFVDGSPRYYYFLDNVNLVEGVNRITVRAVDGAGREDTAEVSVTYEASTYYPPPPEWPAELDFRASGMEVTQAIQGWDMIGPTDALLNHQVPLVAGKKTLVRVYGTVSGIDTPVPDVGCRLRAYTDATLATQLAGSPIYASDRATLVPGETYLEQRLDPDKTFNFILPSEWTQPGTIYLRATVNHFAGIPEADFDVFNDTDVYEVRFNDTNSFCVSVYPIRSQNETGADVTPTWSECLENISRMRQLYPISPDRLTVTLAQRLRTDIVVDAGLGSDPSAGGDLDDLIDLLNAFRRTLGFYYGLATALPCSNMVYLGLTDDTVTHRGVTNSTFPVSLSVASDAEFYKIKTSHESGHAQGLGHVRGCDDPAAPYETYSTYRDPSGTLLPQGSIGDWGVNIHDDNTFNMIDPGTYSDLMSYCGSRWISGYTWNRLFDHFTRFGIASVAAAVPKTTETYLIIAGLIRSNGAAVINPIFRTEQTAGSFNEVGTGGYSLKLLNGNGITLFERRFEPKSEYNLEEYRMFYERVPAAPGTTKIVLQGPGLPNDVSVLAGTGAPTVQILEPSAGFQWPATGERTIRWQGTDPEGDTLIYTVFFSNDLGTTWQVAAEGITATSALVLLDDLPGGNGTCSVRVIATDGINQGEDTIDGPFTKAGQAPMVQIISPRPAGVFYQGDVVLLEGVVTDREDGSISGTNMSWSSDRHGHLGTGVSISTESLSPGLHLIRLIARDSQGMMGTDNVPVLIRVPEVLPDIKVNGMDGPLLTIGQRDSVTITVRMDAGNGFGVPADWWLVAFTPFGMLHFDALTARWMPVFNFNHTAYSGPLFNFLPVQVLRLLYTGLGPQPEPPDMPAGDYLFCFGADMDMNGTLDVEALKFDYVLVRVAKSP